MCTQVWHSGATINSTYRFRLITICRLPRDINCIYISIKLVSDTLETLLLSLPLSLSLLHIDYEYTRRYWLQRRYILLIAFFANVGDIRLCRTRKAHLEIENLRISNKTRTFGMSRLAYLLSCTYLHSFRRKNKFT